jgi:hypothetical protein
VPFASRAQPRGRLFAIAVAFALAFSEISNLKFAIPPWVTAHPLGDGLEVALTVAALESREREEKLQNWRRRKRQRQPALRQKRAKSGAPANSKTDTKTKPQPRQNNRKMNYPSGIIIGAARLIVGSMDAKGQATRRCCR